MLTTHRILHTFPFRHVLDTGIQNGDEALPCRKQSDHSGEQHGILDNILLTYAF